MLECPRCGKPNGNSLLSCERCGHLLKNYYDPKHPDKQYVNKRSTQATTQIVNKTIINNPSTQASRQQAGQNGQQTGQNRAGGAQVNNSIQVVQNTNTTNQVTQKSNIQRSNVQGNSNNKINNGQAKRKTLIANRMITETDSEMSARYKREKITGVILRVAILAIIVLIALTIHSITSNNNVNTYEQYDGLSENNQETLDDLKNEKD